MKYIDFVFQLVISSPLNFKGSIPRLLLDCVK